MIHIARRLAGPRLRALFLASLLGLIAGGVVLIATATRAQESPSASAFTSDRLSIEVVGQGPDVILIPGFASSREVWRPLAERLSGTHRVHLVQLAGFAGEPWTHGDGPFIEPVLGELALYVETAGLERPAVIGHSMGGLIGLMLAQREPELLGRVMSVDSLPFFSVLYGPQVTVETARPYAEQTARGMLAMDDAAFQAGQQQVAIGMVRDEATRAAMVDWSVASDRQALASAIRDVMLADARPQLAAMTTPVWAVYASDADGGAPGDVADALWSREYASLPRVRLVRVDGARHFIMADQPERFAGIVEAFLRD